MRKSTNTHDSNTYCTPTKELSVHITYTYRRALNKLFKSQKGGKQAKEELS